MGLILLCGCWVQGLVLDAGGGDFVFWIWFAVLVGLFGGLGFVVWLGGLSYVGWGWLFGDLLGFISL